MSIDEIVIEHAGIKKTISEMRIEAANGCYSYHHWMKVLELIKEPDRDG